MFNSNSFHDLVVVYISRLRWETTPYNTRIWLYNRRKTRSINNKYILKKKNKMLYKCVYVGIIFFEQVWNVFVYFYFIHVLYLGFFNVYFFCMAGGLYTPQGSIIGSMLYAQKKKRRKVQFFGATWLVVLFCVMLLPSRIGAIKKINKFFCMCLVTCVLCSFTYMYLYKKEAF